MSGALHWRIGRPIAGDEVTFLFRKASQPESSVEAETGHLSFCQYLPDIIRQILSRYYSGHSNPTQWVDSSSRSIRTALPYQRLGAKPANGLSHRQLFMISIKLVSLTRIEENPKRIAYANKRFPLFGFDRTCYQSCRSSMCAEKFSNFQNAFRPSVFHSIA